MALERDEYSVRCAGLDWVAANAVRPAVVTLSLGVPAGAYSRGMEDAVRNMVLNHSISVIVASGALAVNSTCCAGLSSRPTHEKDERFF